MTDYTKVTQEIMYQSSTVSYWVEGNSAHPPVILLSGFTGTHGDLLELARHLKDRFFLIIPEFPGWGESPEGESFLTIEDYAKVVEHLVSVLAFPEVTIVGHCMGATIAIECGVLFPKKIKQLILISPPYQNGTMGQTFFAAMTKLSKSAPSYLRPLFFFWRSRILTIPMSFFVLQTRRFSKKLKIIKKTLTSQTHQDEHVVETNWNSLITYNYQKARRIKLPVHILHGEKDMLIQPRQAKKLAQLFQHVTLEFIPHAGHLPPIETPERLAREIKKYLI